MTQQNTNIKQCNLNVVEEQKNKQTKAFASSKAWHFVNGGRLRWTDRNVKLCKFTEPRRQNVSAWNVRIPCTTT